MFCVKNSVNEIFLLFCCRVHLVAFVVSEIVSKTIYFKLIRVNSATTDGKVKERYERVPTFIADSLKAIR